MPNINSIIELNLLYRPKHIYTITCMPMRNTHTKKMFLNILCIRIKTVYK